jgi:serine/threonine-protein kinase
MTTSASITCTGCRHAYVDSALFCPNCGRPKVRESTADALVGTLLGERFQVQEQIGQGGSGTIYRAEHVTLRRKVAIKVLHTELSRDDLAVERFRREATTVAEIDNEHIVEIHDFGRTPDGRLYLAMELLEGETLDAVLAREKTLSIERVADILIQVGEALMEAHAIGYIHRDLRPRNVYLAVRRGKANFVKLFDFGLSKLVETDAQAASTSLGMTFGDPRYMSPEQARGDRIDRRADIYQLGCVAYEMLTGTPPFTGNRVFDILTKQVTEIPSPVPTRRQGVPLWMEAAVAKMLAKDPENRFATTTRMVEALRRGLETGEVMEDVIARRRESIPPPSVSRVMQRFGMTSPTDTPREATPKPELPATPEPAPAPAAKMVGVPAPAPPPLSKATLRYDGPPPRASAEVRAEVAPPPAVPAAPSRVIDSPSAPLPVLPAAAAEPPAAAPRRRTGTPKVGVPVVATDATAPAEAIPLPPVTGSIEAPTGRAKRPSSQAGTSDSIGISQVWYADGERASEEAENAPSGRARKLISPSSTDMSMYDEPARGKRWPLLVGVLVVGVVGATVAFAVTRGGHGKAEVPPPPRVASSFEVTADAAPSQEIGADTPDAAVVAAAPVDAAVAVAPVKKDVPVVAHVDHPKDRHTGGGGTTDSFFGTDDPSKRRPGGGGTTTSTGSGSGSSTTTTTTVVPTNTNTSKGSGSTGVSGAGGPVDPYGNDGPSDPGDGAPPEKKAEYFANLGQQQLIGGDTANAAANFKRATELDARNVTAVTGMGEIALRQGLFGDAIAHLRKASKLAPKSARVFTLLGEAYLNSGQNAPAADNFKKALQLDPDNARAREGYNEASSRVPPPDDDH